MESISSKSEINGIELLKVTDLKVLSIGISTAGRAEIRMADLEPRRRIIATTLDKDGANFVRDLVRQHRLEDRISVRVEDVASEHPHSLSESFDFVYARLVLHYLSRQQLSVALDNLHRALKPRGRLFVVVRSDECQEANFPDNAYDKVTGLTTYMPTNSTRPAKRFFHNQVTIRHFMEMAGFEIVSIEQFDEMLSPGFGRDSGIWVANNVIELLAQRV